jgi:hypothetical protein
MAKVSRGRLSGVDGMNTHSAPGLLAWAKRLELQVKDPRNQDDPKWLHRQSEKIRQLADKKLAGRLHKLLQMKRRGSDA